MVVETIIELYKNKTMAYSKYAMAYLVHQYVIQLVI